MVDQELIDAVKAHALDHYSTGGWDYIVECWSDADIADAIKGARSSRHAIALVAETAGLLAERRDEVRAAGGEY